ncbi:hypothetical protein CPC08DRAFT_778469 [Agrocybe pediades]|nr:hypothetical protein CPC08DRAFT_778469 [Agrocybe pediades]
MSTAAAYYRLPNFFVILLCFLSLLTLSCRASLSASGTRTVNPVGFPATKASALGVLLKAVCSSGDDAFCCAAGSTCQPDNREFGQDCCPDDALSCNNMNHQMHQNFPARRLHQTPPLSTCSQRSRKAQTFKNAAYAFISTPKGVLSPVSMNQDAQPMHNPAALCEPRGKYSAVIKGLRSTPLILYR